MRSFAMREAEPYEIPWSMATCLLMAGVASA
jgi:hypothetical protein